MTLNTGH